MHLEQIVRVERTGLMGWVVRLLDRALRGCGDGGGGAVCIPVYEGIG